MQVQGFSHVTINVKSLTRALPFYVQTLGMQLLHQGSSDVYLEWGDAWVCLLERPDKAEQQEQRGVDHVAFYISERDFHDAVQILQDNNVPIVRGPIQRGNGWTVNFLDPDGTQLELHTATLMERMKVWR